MRVKIDVTASDIRLGQKPNKLQLRGMSCPAARAAKRKIRGELEVGDCISVVVNDEGYLAIELPEKAKAFVSLADEALINDKISLKPISFTVNVPKELVK